MLYALVNSKAGPHDLGPGVDPPVSRTWDEGTRHMPHSPAAAVAVAVAPQMRLRVISTKIDIAGIPQYLS